MTKRYSIVGTQYTGTPESFVAALQPGTPVKLVREPNNPKDTNAVAVYVDSTRIGYVPMKQNAVLAQFIDAEGRPPLAMDSITGAGRIIEGKFVRSPKSGFPMVEVA